MKIWRTDSHSHAAVSSSFYAWEQESASAMSQQRKIDFAFSILAWLLQSAKVVDALNDGTETAAV
jgi:hypothetical protein